MNVNSNYINVFPSAARNWGRTDPFSRLMSESSLVSIINKLVDTQSFVITNVYDGGKPFEFNVFGYYFKVRRASDITDSSTFSSSNEIYAVIQISSVSGASLTFEELNGVDVASNPSDPVNTSVYMGVSFVDDVTGVDSDPSKHYLLILQKSSGNWIIPEESKVKFTHINGGII